MKLSIKDRIVILNMLPKTGDSVTLTIKHDIVKKLAIQQDEMKELDMVSAEGKITWKQDKEKENNFEFTEIETRMIRDAVDALDKAKELTDDSLEIYKLFVTSK